MRLNWFVFRIRNWSHIFKKSWRFRRFNSDRDELWPECSLSKYASIDGVWLFIWYRTCNMAAVTLFHAKKCCYLMSAHTSATTHIFSSVLLQFLIHITYVLDTCRRFVTFLPCDASAERGDATVSRPSVCPSVCLSVRNDQVPWPHTLEFFENNFTAK